jgi:hypothetical protein
VRLSPAVRAAASRLPGAGEEAAAEHLARLGLTMHEQAQVAGVSMGTASRLSRPGFRVQRPAVEPVLALDRAIALGRGGAFVR